MFEDNDIAPFLVTYIYADKPMDHQFFHCEAEDAEQARHLCAAKYQGALIIDVEWLAAN